MVVITRSMKVDEQPHGACESQDLRCSCTASNGNDNRAPSRLGELYVIESEIRGSPAEERLAVRKGRTVPQHDHLPVEKGVRAA